MTTTGPLEKAIARRRALLAENADLHARIDQNTAEIAQIETGLAIMRNYAPLGQLPGLDEDVRAVYGDLASMTVPDGLAAILRRRGEPLSVRELMTILEKGGKLTPDAKNNMIGVIGALKRSPERFRKAEDKKGSTTWMLVQSNGHLPGFELSGEKVTR